MKKKRRGEDTRRGSRTGNEEKGAKQGVMMRQEGDKKEARMIT